MGYTFSFFLALLWSLGSSPRMWGIQCPLLDEDFPCDGSSPRMWGIRPSARFRAGSVRFIPTHVGYTISPRFHGGPLAGSSPRMWGIRHEGGAPCVRVRFIPTHVGYTKAKDLLYEWYGGSSPRMWGIRSLASC